MDMRYSLVEYFVRLKYNQTILSEQRNIQRKGPTSVQKLL